MRRLLINKAVLFLICWNDDLSYWAQQQIWMEYLHFWNFGIWVNKSYKIREDDKNDKVFQKDNVSVRIRLHDCSDLHLKLRFLALFLSIFWYCASINPYRRLAKLSCFILLLFYLYDSTTKRILIFIQFKL